MADTWPEPQPRAGTSRQAQTARCGLYPADDGGRKWAWRVGTRRKSVHPEGGWMVLTQWKWGRTHLRDVLVVILHRIFSIGIFFFFFLIKRVKGGWRLRLLDLWTFSKYLPVSEQWHDLM